MLRLWVSRFNAQGIDRLTYRPRPGRPRNLDAARVESDIFPLVDDPSQAGGTHWTIVKLCGWLREEKQIVFSYRTLVRYLPEHEYVHKIPRPVPERPDREAWEDQREAFALELLELLENRPVRISSAMKPVLNDPCGTNGSNGFRVRPRPIRGVMFPKKRVRASRLAADDS